MAGYVKRLMEGINGKGKGENDWLSSASPSDRFYGFENFGNTCYSNSVVQALYYCKPFRECALNYCHPHSSTKQVAVDENIKLDQIKIDRKAEKSPVNQSANQTRSNQTRSFTGMTGTSSPLLALSPTKPISASAGARSNLDAPLEGNVAGAVQVNFSSGGKKDVDVWTGTLIESLVAGLHLCSSNDTLLDSIQSLFSAIASQKKQVGVIGPKQFITKLKQCNEIFASTQQQDAHEMFIYLINEIAETLQKQKKEVTAIFRKNGLIPKEETDSSSKPVLKTWIHDLFEGQLTNETKCLNCESVTNRDEPFLDLSVDIEQHTSLSTCLRQFSKSEVLRHKNKFFCDTCNSLQEAEKRMKIKRLPNVLAVHLKRFKYQEQLGRFSKLSYRVCFTEQLGVFNTVDEAENSERVYDLCAIIVHIGSGPHHGHYVAVVKNNNQWILLDDEEVHPLDESDLFQYFGESNLGTGYLFIYNSADYSSESLLKSMMPDEWRPPVIPVATPIPVPAATSATSGTSAAPSSQIPEAFADLAFIRYSQEIGNDDEANNKTQTPGISSSTSVYSSINQSPSPTRKLEELPKKLSIPYLIRGVSTEASTGGGAPSNTDNAAVISSDLSKEGSGWGWFKQKR